MVRPEAQSGHRYGDLSVYALHELIDRCTRELREWEEVKTKGYAAWEKDREDAMKKFRESAGKVGAK